MGTNLTNPFSGFRSEVTIENIHEYFVKPYFFENVTKDRLPVIVEGERGTGKTTLLKRLSHEFNYTDYFNGIIDYWGIYHKFDKNLVSAFDNLPVDDVLKRSVFGHYVSTILIECLIKSLKEYQNEFTDSEIENIIGTIKNNYFDYDVEINGLDGLAKYLNKHKFNTFEYLRNGGAKLKICNEGTILQEVATVLASTELMKDRVIYFLIDECESLAEYQQRIINSYLKNADKNQTFVLGYKTDGMLDKGTAGGDYIRMPDDYVKIEILSNINDEEKSKSYSDFIKKVCSLRLEKYFKQNEIVYSDRMLDIETYLGKYGFEDELEYIDNKANDRIHRLYDDQFKHICELPSMGWISNQYKRYKELGIFAKRYILFVFDKKKNKLTENQKQEMLNIIYYGIEKMNSNYHNNYSIGIIYLIYKDMQTNRILGGYDKIISISGGVIRYFLEICDSIFQKTCRDENFFSSNKLIIDVKIQSDSIYDTSKSNAKEISSIPVHGIELEKLTRSVGNVFKIYHKVPTIPKIEVNHFEIVNYNDGDDKKLVCNVLRMGVIWGIFKAFKENKKTNDIEPSLNDKSYMIHPIFTPHFGISFRKKKNMRFDLSDILTFCVGDAEKIRIATKTITMNNPEAEDIQMNFFDVESRY